MLPPSYPTFLIISVTLLGLFPCRARVENGPTEGVGSPGISVPESPLSPALIQRALERRQINHSCRRICSAKTPSEPIREQSQSLIRRSLTGRGLKKRVLDALPEDAKGMDNFMVEVVDEALANLPFDDSRTDAKFQTLGKRQKSFDMGIKGLSGCTMLTVVSPNAVWMAHFYENLAFSPDPRLRITEHQAFEAHITPFLKGTRQVDKLGVPALANRVAGFGRDNIQAFILTPRKEVHFDDGSYTYVDGLNYEPAITKIRGLVTEIFGRFGRNVPVTVYTYDVLDGAKDEEGENLLQNTARGRILFQWGGPRPPNEAPGRPLARLIFEKGPLLREGIANENDDLARLGIVWQLNTPTSTSSTKKARRGWVSGIMAKGLFGQRWFSDAATKRREEQHQSASHTPIFPRQFVFPTNSSATNSSQPINIISLNSTAKSSSFLTSATPSLSTLSVITSSETLFPSSVFTRPSIVTVSRTTTENNGRVTTATITRTTDTGGPVIPITTIAPIEATKTASALVVQLSEVSSAVEAFSASPSDQALATSASSNIIQAQEDIESFRTALGSAAGGLCLIFCSLAASVAGALGTLNAAVNGVAAGTLPPAALGAGLVGLDRATSELKDKSRPDEDAVSTTEDKNSITSAPSSIPSSTSSCAPVTITDLSVSCATGVVNGQDSTSCTTVTSPRVATCSAEATTVSSFGDLCPLYVTPLSPGPPSMYSYEGFTMGPVIVTAEPMSDPPISIGLSSTVPSSTITQPSKSVVSSPEMPSASTIWTRECSQDRLAGAPSGREIEAAILDNDTINKICSTDKSPWRSGNTQKTYSWSVGPSLAITVTNLDAASPLEFCTTAIRGIIDNCILLNSYFGGVWIQGREQYNISNWDYPKNQNPLPAKPTESTNLHVMSGCILINNAPRCAPDAGPYESTYNIAALPTDSQSQFRTALILSGFNKSQPNHLHLPATCQLQAYWPVDLSDIYFSTTHTNGVEIGCLYTSPDLSESSKLANQCCSPLDPNNAGPPSTNPYYAPPPPAPPAALGPSQITISPTSHDGSPICASLLAGSNTFLCAAGRFRSDVVYRGYTATTWAIAGAGDDTENLFLPIEGEPTGSHLFGINNGGTVIFTCDDDDEEEQEGYKVGVTRYDIKSAVAYAYNLNDGGIKGCGSIDLGNGCRIMLNGCCVGMEGCHNCRDVVSGVVIGDNTLWSPGDVLRGRGDGG